MRLPINRPHAGDLGLACRGSEVFFVGVRRSQGSGGELGPSDLCRVSADGALEIVAELPDPNPRTLVWAEVTGSLYAIADDAIPGGGLLRVDMASGAVECVPQPGGRVRLIRVAGDRLLVRTQAKVSDSESTLRVVELGTGRGLFEARCFTARAQLTPDAELSADGSLVAYCTAEGRFELARVDDRRVVSSFESYPMLGNLRFHPSRPWLVGTEANGSCRLFVFDFDRQRDETMHFEVAREPGDPMPDEGHRMLLGVTAVAFTPSGGELALMRSGGVELYDVESGRRERRLPLWAARNAELRFLDDAELVARTNAGLIEWIRAR